MLIVLSLYALIAWLIFGKFKWLPWNRTWKGAVYGIAVVIGLVVIGALQYYTPASSKAVVQAPTQKIFPVITGRVQQVNVHESEQVSAGDVLFQIDPEPFEHTLAQREAALTLAQIQLRDMQALVKKQAAARATLDVRTSELDQAQAQRDIAAYELENTDVLAPADGIVVLAVLEEGEVVSANTAVLNLIKQGDIRIATAFKQNGLRKIEVGSAATVIFSAAPGEIYETEISSVPPATVQGQFSAQSTDSALDALMSSSSLYPVRVAFPADAPDHLRRPGTEASVTVFTEEDNPINVLAKILQWIGTWMAYIF